MKNPFKYFLDNFIFIVYEDIRIRSSLSREQIEENLRDFGQKVSLTEFGDGKIKYRLHEENIVVNISIWHRNSWLPYFVGKFEACEDGTVIAGQIRTTKWVQYFSLFWVSGLVLNLAVMISQAFNDVDKVRSLGTRDFFEAIGSVIGKPVVVPVGMLIFFVIMVLFAKLTVREHPKKIRKFLEMITAIR